MSRFFVGQRVRIARNVGWQHPMLNSFIGKEGVICSVDQSWNSPLRDHPIRLREFPGVLFHPDDLEPITFEEHKPCEEQFKRDLDRLLEREGVSA